jgi:hypothetical protein
MVTILMRAMELAVSTPFRALAAIRAKSPFGHDPQWPEHDEDR